MIIHSKWDQRFMRLAREVSTWSKDPAAQIGDVIIRDRRILATGYNGFPEGIEDTADSYWIDFYCPDCRKRWREEQ